jgi:hypothetical protein
MGAPPTPTQLGQATKVRIMANKTLFSSTRGALLPAADALNREGVGAYEYVAKHKLAQYAATGCLSNTFYANGREQGPWCHPRRWRMQCIDLQANGTTQAAERRDVLNAAGRSSVGRARVSSTDLSQRRIVLTGSLLGRMDHAFRSI